MKKERFNTIPSELHAEVEALADLPEEQIRTDDVPEVLDWSNARRGVFYQPLQEEITLQLDAELIEWFKAHRADDEGYRTSINKALREYVAQQQI